MNTYTLTAWASTNPVRYGVVGGLPVPIVDLREETEIRPPQREGKPKPYHPKLDCAPGSEDQVSRDRE